MSAYDELVEERFEPVMPPDRRPQRRHRPWTEEEQRRHREALSDWWDGRERDAA